jgi:hypothetical protein
METVFTATVVVVLEDDPDVVELSESAAVPAVVPEQPTNAATRAAIKKAEGIFTFID